MPKVLLEFIKLLSQHNYLSLPEANTIIYYIAQLSEPDPTVSRGWAERGPRMGAGLRGGKK